MQTTRAYSRGFSISTRSVLLNRTRIHTNTYDHSLSHNTDRFPQVRTLEQGKTIEELENAVNKLAKSKHKTSAELHDLKNELEMTENEAKAKKARSSQTVQQLNSELQTTKQALEESRVREKQVNTVLFIMLLFFGGGGGEHMLEKRIYKSELVNEILHFGCHTCH